MDYGEDKAASGGASSNPLIAHDQLVASLRAIAEPTRLRIIDALSTIELSVTEVCSVVGQSQPRVSRHLKILGDAGILDRHAQGTSAFYRLTADAAGRSAALAALSLLDPDDPTRTRDRARIDAIRKRRADEAAEYFEQVASTWTQLRALHVEDGEVEDAVLAAVGEGPIERLLDLGTGTGRMLDLFSGRIDEGVGIDSSRQMLNLARTKLDEAGAHNCRVLYSDVYDLDIAPRSVDVAIFHHVLHFLDDPAMAVAEAAATLKPGGRLVVVDFAPHDLESLRFEHRHRRLGFGDSEVVGWLEAAGLECSLPRHLTPRETTGTYLTTTIWTATSPAVDLAAGTHGADIPHMEEAS